MKFDAKGRQQKIYDHATKEVIARAVRGVFDVEDVFIADELRKRGYPEIKERKIEAATPATKGKDDEK